MHWPELCFCSYEHLWRVNTLDQIWVCLPPLPTALGRFCAGCCGHGVRSGWVHTARVVRCVRAQVKPTPTDKPLGVSARATRVNPACRVFATEVNRSARGTKNSDRRIQPVHTTFGRRSTCFAMRNYKIYLVASKLWKKFCLMYQRQSIFHSLFVGEFVQKLLNF